MLDNTSDEMARLANSETIILSPHLDDGVLSLGGLMSKRENQILLATFFTKNPNKIIHTKWDKISGFSDSNTAMQQRLIENKNALSNINTVIKNYDYPDFQYRKEDTGIETNIEKDIENLINTYQNKEVFIYGPATFGSKITHPDHQILHNAFMNVLKNNTKINVHFFIYEDFPYVYEFNSFGLGNLKTYLEKTENIKFEEVPIELNKAELAEKIENIYKYSSQIKAFVSLNENIKNLAQKFYQKRCKTILPTSYTCEIVYKPI